jgi:hypothetical protein
VGADPINFANAQQTTATKAEASLSAKITCKDFRKNSDGTWTSDPDTKIGANAFPNHTFGTNGVSIGDWYTLTLSMRARARARARNH